MEALSGPGGMVSEIKEPCNGGRLGRVRQSDEGREKPIFAHVETNQEAITLRVDRRVHLWVFPVGHGGTSRQACAGIAEKIRYSTRLVRRSNTEWKTVRAGDWQIVCRALKELRQNTCIAVPPMSLRNFCEPCATCQSTESD